MRPHDVWVRPGCFEDPGSHEDPRCHNSVEDAQDDIYSVQDDWRSRCPENPDVQMVQSVWMAMPTILQNSFPKYCPQNV